MQVHAITCKNPPKKLMGKEWASQEWAGLVTGLQIERMLEGLVWSWGVYALELDEVSE